MTTTVQQFCQPLRHLAATAGVLGQDTKRRQSPATNARFHTRRRDCPST